MAKAQSKNIEELLGDNEYMAAQEKELIEAAQGSTELSLKHAIQIEAFKVMLSSAKDIGLVAPGLLTRKREQTQSIIADCIRFAIAVGHTFDETTND